MKKLVLQDGVCVEIDVSPDEIAVTPQGKDRRAALVDALSEKRWRVETGGITLPNGMRIGTTREDQGSIAEALTVLPFTPLTEVSFKSESGFARISVEMLQQIAAAVGMHKQACYDNEMAHVTAIALLTESEIDSYDIETGWPGGSGASEPSQPIVS